MNAPSWVLIALEIAGIAGGVIATVAAVVMWFVAHTLVTRSAFTRYAEDHEKLHDALDARLDRGEQKSAALGADMRHQPGHGDIDLLRRDIAELKASVRELSAGEKATNLRLSHMESQLDRLVDFHLAGEI